MIRSRSIALALGLVLVAFSLPALAGERLHHKLELTLEPASAELSVIDRIEVDGYQRLAIKPAPGLAIETITVGGEVLEVTSEDGVTWIPLPDAGAHEVEITYGGRLEADRSHGGLSPMVSADGVFLPYGIGWLANGGAKDDRATYELTLDVPAPYKAIATGALTDEQESDGRYRATFEATTPSEPPSVFAGDLRVEERQHGDIRLRTYFPEEAAALSPTYLDRAAGYIDLFEERIGDYPYDGFAMIAAPLPVGLGFPGLTYISAQILPMPFMQTRSLAHEILHNWWANGVFVDYAAGNWAEGLTTYMADYGLAEIEGEDAAWEMRLGWLRDFAALPAERDRPIDSFRSKGHDADQVLGYNKVAMVFHMLKQELGDEAFRIGLQDFWKAYQFETAGWSDLRASFEKAAGGRDLAAFFGPWISEAGAPTLSLDKAERRETADGHAIDLAISSSPSTYDLLVPIQIETPGGTQTETVRLVEGAAETTFEISEKPLSIGIDQRHDLFRRLAADEAPPIMRDVTLDSDTLTVIAANGSDEAAAIAEQLAARTLDTGVRLAEADDQAIATSPLMLVGLAGDIAPILTKAGLDADPETLNSSGTARSWVAARDDAPPALVVEAQDEEALGALLRPLPHYGRQSYLVFEGRKVVEKGVWPTGDNALVKRFE